MSGPAGGTAHAALMDGVYRHQRHIYDLTRKYYLLGRDELIADLAVPPGGSVLEIGCGTGRNLALAAQRFPQARCFGIDISHEMLATARAKLPAGRVTLAQGDATAFDPQALFGKAAFDRVFVSYALSMIPGWEQALRQAAGCVAPGGSLHVVDFGQQERLPGAFRSALRSWLARFHVEPRASLAERMDMEAVRIGGTLEGGPIFRGYAWRGVIRL